jgi:hypothetical protein
MAEIKTSTPAVTPETKRPTYEKPRVQVMTERDVLNTFQITQAMATWWGAC